MQSDLCPISRLCRPRDQGLAWLSADFALKKNEFFERYNGAPGWKPGAPQSKTDKT